MSIWRGKVIFRGPLTPDRWLNFAPYFTPEEFADRETGECEMDPAFMTALMGVRDLYTKPLVIRSGYRSLAHNRAVGGVEHSQHLFGRAADLHVPRADLYRVVAYAQRMGMTGIGIRAHGPEEHRLLHLDRGAETPPGYAGPSPRPDIWTYA